MSRVTITVKTAANDERELRVLGSPPTQVTLTVATEQHDTGVNADLDEYNKRFGGKTFIRVGDSLLYEEEV